MANIKLNIHLSRKIKVLGFFMSENTLWNASHSEIFLFSIIF